MKNIIKNSCIILSLFTLFALIIPLRSQIFEVYKSMLINKTSVSSFIPSNQYYEYTNLGYQALRSELLWIKTNQYIAENIFTQDYKEYMALYVDRIISMHPEFVEPYISAQLLLPSYNKRYSELTVEQRNKNIENAIKISKKGITHFCDKDKLNMVDLDLIKKDVYIEPCTDSQLPYYLGYIYYHYKNDPISSSYRYSVAASHKEAQLGAKKLAIIMQSKAGKNEIAYELYLSLLKNSAQQEDNLLCNEIIKILDRRDFSKIPPKKNELGFLQKIESGIYPLFESGELDGNCEYYAGRVLRELNLYYLNTYHSNIQAPIILTDYDLKDDQGIYYVLNAANGLYEPEMMLHDTARKKFAQ